MPKNYRNHIWFKPGDDNARRIESGEQVMLDESGQNATVIDCLENEGVVNYWVELAGGFRMHVKPNQITPLVNP